MLLQRNVYLRSILSRLWNCLEKCLSCLDPNGHHVENFFKKFYGDMCILGDKKLAVTSAVVYISK